MSVPYRGAIHKIGDLDELCGGVCLVWWNGERERETSEINSRDIRLCKGDAAVIAKLPRNTTGWQIRELETLTLFMGFVARARLLSQSRRCLDRLGKDGSETSIEGFLCPEALSINQVLRIGGIH
jgi:hypothetical protein